MLILLFTVHCQSSYQMLLEELIPANTITTSRILQQHLFHLLQSCKTLKYLSQIHTQIIIHGFSQKSYIIARLLSLYLASGHLLPAHKVFKEVKNPSVTLWNQMIRGHARSESPRKSVILFNQMRAAEAEPNGLTYSFLLSGCARSGLLREGEQMHGRVLVNGYYPNVFMKANLINLYGMAGAEFGVEYAQRVFDEMGERNIVCWNSMLVGYMRCGNVEGARRVFDKMMERNVVSWTTMIAGYARNGKCRQALILFNKMRRAHVDLDQVSLVAALSACAELGDLRLGRWIHTYIEEKLSGKSQSLLISLNNALIHMYASCGVIEEAYEVFRWMPKRNNISWTTMICAFAKHGYANKALAIFELMQSLGPNKAKPDEITFIGVLSACSHAGLVNKGCQLFMSMIQSWGINPGIEHYGCMVDLFSRAGLLDEANDIIKTMPMKPNEAIWGALLGGCRIHKHYTLACYVARKLVAELDPDQAAGYLMLLADVHATAKMWQDVATLKQKMIEMGVKKPSGRSRVQINGVVDDFVAGDRNHRHASPIYNMLALINRQVYKPEKWQAFSIVDDE